MCRILHLHSGLMWGNISPAGCVYLIIYLHLHKIFLIYCLKKLIIRVPPPKEIYLKFFLIVNITVRFFSWPLHAFLWGGPLRAWGLFKPSGRGARSLLLPRAAQWHRLEDSPDGITDGFCVRYVLLFTRIMSGIFKIPSWYPYWYFVCLFKKAFISKLCESHVRGGTWRGGCLHKPPFEKDFTWIFHCFLFVSTEKATFASHLCLKTFLLWM